MSDDLNEPAPAKKRKKSVVLTPRTKELFESLGFTYANVEKWVGPYDHRGKRIDMFGFADEVVMRPGVGIIALQTCDASNFAAHRKKILDEPRSRIWLESGGRIQIVSWRKRTVPVMRKWWTETRTEITLGDFA